MRLELHNRLTRTAHVQYLHFAPVHMERRHVIRVARIERNPQKRARRRAGAGRGRGRGWREVFRGGRLVQDRRVLERAQVERAQRAVRADRDEDVGAPGQPRDVVHLAIVRDELGDSGGRLDVPHGARRVDGGGDDVARGLLVPREARERGTCRVVLDLTLLLCVGGNTE